MSKFKVGQRVKITPGKGKKLQSGCPAGVGTVTTPSTSGGFGVGINLKLDKVPNSFYFAYDYEVEAIEQSKKDIESTIASLKQEIYLEESKLKWMEDVGSETYDSEEFTIWTGLDVIEDSNKTRKEKVQALRALFNK